MLEGRSEGNPFEVWEATLNFQVDSPVIPPLIRAAHSSLILQTSGPHMCCLPLVQ